MSEKKIVDEVSIPLLGNAFCVRSLQQAQTGEIVLRTWWVTAQAITASHRQRLAAEVAALQAVKHPAFVPPQGVQVRPQGVCLFSSLPTARPLDERIYRNDAWHFAAWLLDRGLTPQTMTRSDMIAYRDSLATSAYSKATKQRRFSVARRLMNEQYISQRNPERVTQEVKGFVTFGN